MTCTLTNLRNMHRPYYRSQLPMPRNVIISRFAVFFSDANSKIATEEKGLPDVLRALSDHPSNAELVESATAAIFSLSMEGKRLQSLSSYRTNSA